MRVRLSKEHGVNPTIEKKVCPITGKEWETGSVLLLGTSCKGEALMYTTTGYEICPEVKEILEKDNRVALVGTDEEKSTITQSPGGDTIKPEDAWRTGRLAYIKRSILSDVFDLDISDDVPFLFVQDEVITHLQSQIETQDVEDVTPTT